MLKKTVAAPFRAGATATILDEKMVSNTDVYFLVLSATLIVELRPWSSPRCSHRQGGAVGNVCHPEIAILKLKNVNVKYAQPFFHPKSKNNAGNNFKK